MAVCDACADGYENILRIVQDKQFCESYSFQYATHALAPEREHCGMRVIGYGAQCDAGFFRLVHCAEGFGPSVLSDHRYGVPVAGRS